MSPDEGEVVALFPTPGDDDAPLHTKPREKYCPHNQTEVDTDARRVYCRSCKREVPAFDVLRKLAREGGEKWRESRDAAQREARLAQGRLEDLKREERNTKARIRNAKARAKEQGVTF